MGGPPALAPLSHGLSREFNLRLDMQLALAISAALAYTIGGVFMKLSGGFAHWLPSCLVYLCFLIGATLQIQLTNTGNLGLTYVLVLGLEASCAAMMGYLFFNESYSLGAIAGLSLITLGTLLLRSELA